VPSRSAEQLQRRRKNTHEIQHVQNELCRYAYVQAYGREMDCANTRQGLRVYGLGTAGTGGKCSVPTHIRRHTPRQFSQHWDGCGVDGHGFLTELHPGGGELWIGSTEGVAPCKLSVLNRVVVANKMHIIVFERNWRNFPKRMVPARGEEQPHQRNRLAVT